MSKTTRDEYYEARRAVLSFMRAAGDEVTTAEVARHRNSSHGSAMQLLYSMRDDLGVVEAKEVRLRGGGRQLFWRLTGKPLLPHAADHQESTQPRPVGLDHEPLARALGMCLVPPREIAPTRVNTCDGGDG